jgi:methyl-accepting chemotaxis protein
MQFLGRFRILPKIIAIVLMLASLMAIMAHFANSALRDQNENAQRMARAAKRSMLAARANVNLMSIAGAQFRGALDPRDDNRKEVRHVIEQQVGLFKERLDEVAKTSDQELQAMLPAVRDGFTAYQQSVNSTLAAVEAASTAKTSETAQKLMETVMKSDSAAQTLRGKMNSLAERMTKLSEELEQSTADEYVATSRSLIIISIIGVLVGLTVGLLVGQFGISKPIQEIVTLLQALARGEYDTTIHSVERRDEVGDVAKTALVFKENGVAKIRMETEQRETEKRAAAQRRQDMLQVADQFETAVGEIIDMVSSASTELEASAGSLTKTADHSQELATMVAAGSEEASRCIRRNFKKRIGPIPRCSSHDARRVRSEAPIAAQTSAR